MKIDLHTIPELSIEEFADTNSLVMEVHERKDKSLPRYYARFKSAECKEGFGMLVCAFGDGESPEAAISDYANAISNRTLVINAMKPTRREIEVPRLHNNSR